MSKTETVKRNKKNYAFKRKYLLTGRKTTFFLDVGIHSNYVFAKKDRVLEVR